MANLDLLIAGGLIVIVAVLIFSVRIGVLSRKNIPAAAAVLLAGLGIVVWRERRVRRTAAELAALRKEINERQQKLKKLRNDFDATDREVAAAMAPLQEQLRASSEEVLRLRAKNAQERQKIADMTPDQVIEAAGRITF